MTDILVKHKVGSKRFELFVDEELALKIRKGESEDVSSAIRSNEIFHNIKSGEKAGQAELKEAYGTVDFNEVALKIIKKGDIEISQGYRDEARETKIKQIVEWFVRNAVDAKSGRPFTPDSISKAIDQTGINIENKPIDQQIPKISEALKTVIPLKIEKKKLIITVPAVYTGKVYGILNEYKEKEDWLGNGDLKVTVNIPIGLQSEFYDKLNAITHGAAITEEVKEKIE